MKPLVQLPAFNPVTTAHWRADVRGGLAAASVALPLGLALGVVSGAGPVAGLYCAICTGLFAALFGGTPTQIAGPTGPMAIVMAGVFASFADQPAAATVVSDKGVILDFTDVPHVDDSAALALETIIDRAAEADQTVILTGLRRPVVRSFIRYGMLHSLKRCTRIQGRLDAIEQPVRCSLTNSRNRRTD